MKKVNVEPLVSVIMPVYNGERFLRRAIDSILNQTYQNIELLIADDGSRDKTWQVISSYASPKIKAFRFKKNIGAFPRANFLYAKAKGKYICVMDADDISKPIRIERQMEFLAKNPKVVVVGSQAEIINESSETVGQKEVPLEHGDIYEQFGLVHPMIHPSCLVRKVLLPNKKKLYKTDFGVNSDYQTLIGLLNYGKFANLSESLLMYRIHQNNSSLKNLKKGFVNTLAIRWEAINKGNYKISFLNAFLTVLEIPVILLLPTKLIDYLYPIARGIKINRDEKHQKILTTPDFSFS